MMLFPLVLFVLFSPQEPTAIGLTPEQRLILACHGVDVDGVIASLRNGANVNATFGNADRHLFRDPWSLGSPVAASNWTPLIALASSSAYPPPPREIENTLEDLDWAQGQKGKIEPGIIRQREQDSLTIAAILLSHKANIDADDGYGQTALAECIYLKKRALATFLIRFNANVNSKTGIYIDGPGDTTPLHYAYWSEELTALLLAHGADPKAKTTTGETPLDWVQDSEIRKLYKSP